MCDILKKGCDIMVTTESVTIKVPVGMRCCESSNGERRNEKQMNAYLFFDKHQV